MPPPMDQLDAATDYGQRDHSSQRGAHGDVDRRPEEIDHARHESVATAEAGHARGDANDQAEESQAQGMPLDGITFALWHLPLAEALPGHANGRPQKDYAQYQPQRLGVWRDQCEQPRAEDYPQDAGTAHVESGAHVKIMPHQMAPGAGNGREYDGEEGCAYGYWGFEAYPKMNYRQHDAATAGADQPSQQSSSESDDNEEYPCQGCHRFASLLMTTTRQSNGHEKSPTMNRKPFILPCEQRIESQSRSVMPRG